MSETVAHHVTLETSDPTLLVEVFGTELPAVGSRVDLGPRIAAASVKETRVHHGAIDTSIIVNLVVSVTTGVTTKVLGDVLSDLVKRRRGRITVDGVPVSTTPPPQL